MDFPPWLSAFCYNVSVPTCWEIPVIPRLDAITAVIRPSQELGLFLPASFPWGCVFDNGDYVPSA